MQIIRVSIQIDALLEPNRLKMHNVETGEVKRYSEIDPNDKNWIVYDSAQVLHDSDWIENEEIQLEVLDYDETDSE